MTTSTATAIGSLSAPPALSSVALASVTGAVAVCSLVGNMFVFLTISKSKTLQRINNALILSLAVAGVVRSSVVVPLYAALLLVEVSPTDQHWFCPLYTTVLVFCEVAVILNVSLIAIERVFVITKPLVYQRTVTCAKVSVVIVSLWIFSLVFGALQTLRFLPESDDRPELATFTSVVCFSVPSLGYAVFNVTLTLVVPVVTLVVCYGKIFFVVNSQMRRIAPMTSDTYGNSEAAFSYGESWRQTYVTRSTSLSCRDSAPMHHGPFEQRRQPSIFTTDVEPSSAHETERAVVTTSASNFFSTLRPLSNIEEDRLESPKQSSEEGKQKRSQKLTPTCTDNACDHGKVIRILVTQPSRESFDPQVGSGQGGTTPGHDLLLPGAVSITSELEPILSPINLNRAVSVSRSELGQSGTTDIRRGSSVTFDLRSADDPSCELQNDSSQRNYRRGSNAVNLNISTSLAPPQPGDSCLNPALNRMGSIPRRSSHESSTSRVSVNRPLGVPSLTRRNSVARINDNKAFKMTVVVVGTFIVCWMPAKICYLLRVTSGSLISDLTFDIVTCLTFVASALDPYIYNFYSSEFRRALKRVLTCSADKPDMPWM